MPSDDVRLLMPLETAVLLVELAEDVGDLAPGEANAVESARTLVDRAVARHKRASEP
jgi:hypothetical protein